MNDDERSRLAAATVAANLVATASAPVGLGSGRAVFAIADLLGARFGAGLSVVVASSLTAERARAAGLTVTEHVAGQRLALALDGADELDGDLRAIKGGGGALLREKLIAAACDRFVLVAEASKQVARLGQNRPVPVEVVRFAWPDTQARILAHAASAELRVDADGQPFVTDEGHHILDSTLAAGSELDSVARALKLTTGVVEHGLFLDQAHAAILGRPNGTATLCERATSVAIS